MTDETAANQPEQETAAPEKAESAPAEPEKAKVAPNLDQEPEWFVKRIGEFTARFRNEERRASAAEERAAALEKELQAARQKDEKPKGLADFDYDEGKFQAYVMEQVKAEARRVATEADSERQRQTQAERRLQKFREREEAFEKSTPDYRKVAYAESVPISAKLAEAIMDFEDGPELLHHLGTNPRVAGMLHDLPVHLAARELGRIGAELSADRRAKAAALEKAKAEKAVTGAPDPAKTIEASGEPATV